MVKPVKSAGPQFARAFISDNQTFPEPDGSGAMQMHDPARILIVDDNLTNRDILATRLAVHGYDLSQAADGEEAVAAVRTVVPDLVLLDVMMPKLNGIDACRVLKNDPALPFIPIILVTAKADTKGSSINRSVNVSSGEELSAW
jgi:CheY-like chemotaxis protein